MGAEDSLKKLKRKKNAMKKREENSEMGSSQLAQREEKFYRANGESKKKKKSSVDIDETHETSGGSNRSKKLRKNKKRKNGKITKTGVDELDSPLTNADEVRISGKKDVANEPGEDKLQKSRKKKRKNVESFNKSDECNEEEDASAKRNEEMAWATPSKPEDYMASSEGLNEADTRRSSRTGKSKKSGKIKRKQQLLANELSQDNLLEKRGEDAEDEVYQMSSGDEDYSKGMKKWITQYHQSRPGLKVLQERIDDFIMAHEAQEEQARVEREAQAAERGWTVVVQHRGRKKTTDAESGIAVGSVAQAAVLDKMEKKKKKEVGLDFYRFQKREAHRNEIMMLQSKFEQDKKRIQQMRAARKFRPY